MLPLHAKRNLRVCKPSSIVGVNLYDNGLQEHIRLTACVPSPRTPLYYVGHIDIFLSFVLLDGVIEVDMLLYPQLTPVSPDSQCNQAHPRDQAQAPESLHPEAVCRVTSFLVDKHFNCLSGIA